MKQLLFILVLVANLSIWAQEEIRYKIDTEASSLEWKGSKPTGSHTGTVGILDGVLTAENGGLHGSFSVDLNDMVCTDIDDPTSAADLVEHLQGEDFFDTILYPTATFDIISCEIRMGNDGPIGYHVYGNLTIKGITHPVDFPLAIDIIEGGLHCTGELVIVRTKWGINYKSKSVFSALKDQFIFDDIDLKIDLTVRL
ncbi:YceI family protein [Chitinophagales bacterium]|nr:YceI family protein [Chitinophagales bacterium]